MSHYRSIKTSLTDGRLLVQALADLRIQPEVSADLTKNSVLVRNGWDHSQVAIRVPAQEVYNADLAGGSKFFGNGGFGYRWDAEQGSYELVSDPYDRSIVDPVTQRVAQRYGVNTALQAAAAAGWSAFEEAMPDGTVVINCVQY
jgi:hypothetical protein